MPHGDANDRPGVDTEPGAHTGAGMCSESCPHAAEAHVLRLRVADLTHRLGLAQARLRAAGFDPDIPPAAYGKDHG